MSEASADCLADAKADAVVALVECARTSNTSTNRLADAVADAAVAPVECAWTSELAKQSAQVQICQDKGKLRRTRIEAERFRAGWTRLRAAVGGRAEEKNG